MNIVSFKRNFIRFFRDPFWGITTLAVRGCFNWVSDKAYLRVLFWLRLHRKLDLNNPTSYNEKLQWMKLYNRQPLYTDLVDKYEVRKYVSKKIGEEYLIKLLGVYNKFEEIDFNSLPDRFVLKCNHDSGSVFICRDKKTFDFENARRRITASLKRNYYWEGREWPYKNVTPKIVIEEYMEDEETEELRDFKFFCFDGVVKAMFIASDRQKDNEDTKFDFFDREFNHLDFSNGHPNALVMPNKPQKFDEMIKLAETLSANMPHVRVDFYEVNGRVYFGEFTFTHWGGMMPFNPEKWDYIFGEWLKLPNSTNTVD